MSVKHFNIPIFIPELACPFQCIYCDQQKITGTDKLPQDNEIIEKIESHLRSMPSGSEIQLAYFGGNFTGIPQPQQEHYLKLVHPYIRRGEIKSIRLSTRPDFINPEILSMLRDNGVRNIELGVQSLDAEVLKKSRRGYDVDTILRASREIRQSGFLLGMQMMIGLPGDSLERSMETARQIIALGAYDTRIYPTLVIRDTVLEQMFRRGEYLPLTLPTAVDWCSRIIPLFEEAAITVLRVGLHPSDGLVGGKTWWPGRSIPPSGSWWRQPAGKGPWNPWPAEAAGPLRSACLASS